MPGCPFEWRAGAGEESRVMAAEPFPIVAWKRDSQFGDSSLFILAKKGYRREMLSDELYSS